MYVQLLTRMQIMVNGKAVHYQPGDFVDVGKQTAKQWLAQGQARVLDYRRAGLMPAASGIQPWGDPPWDVPEDLNGILDAAPGERTPTLSFYRTLLWSQNAPLRRDVLATGFSLLETWQIAVPLVDYNRLANSFGDDTDRGLTEEVIHDLRVPVYDIRLMFVRRCADTENLMSTWVEECTLGRDVTLAFMRALYIVKPLILPLPITWANADGRDGYL